MRKRILSLLLILVMIVGLLPTVALAKNDDFTVTISMEGLTLGQGYYLEPRTYTLDRINELVKGESWAKPFTADNLTADVVTIAMLKDTSLLVAIPVNLELFYQLTDGLLVACLCQHGII